MRPAEQLCVPRLAPFSQMTYVLQVTSLGFPTHFVPAMLAHGSDGTAVAAVVIAVVGVVDDVAVVVEVIPVVSAVPEYTDEAFVTQT